VNTKRLWLWLNSGGSVVRETASDVPLMALFGLLAMAGVVMIGWAQKRA